MFTINLECPVTRWFMTLALIVGSFIFVNQAFACDNLPVLAVIDKSSGKLIMDADFGQYSHKFGEWQFISHDGKEIFISADKVAVHGMAGEYRVNPDGHVTFLPNSGKTREPVTLAFTSQGFKETVVDEETDNQLISLVD